MGLDNILSSMNVREFPLNFFRCFFPWPQVVSPHMHTDQQYSTKYSRGTLCRSQGFSPHAAPFIVIFCLRTSCFGPIPSPQLWVCWSPPRFPLIDGNSFQAESWNNQRCHFICFPSLGDHVIHHLETSVLKIIVSHLMDCIKPKYFLTKFSAYTISCQSLHG